MALEGPRNTFYGWEAGFSNTTGSESTFLGFGAGYRNTTGGSNVFLGNLAGYHETGSYKLYIDNSTTRNPLIYGEFDSNMVTINGTLTATSFSPSDEHLKKSIEPLQGSLKKVMKLQGVSYEWRLEELPDRGFTNQRQIGLIAQNVEEVLPELVRTDKDGYKAVSYEKMSAILIEAIKEQQKTIAELSDRVAELETKLTLKNSLIR